MKYKQKPFIIEAYQYTGKPDNPGWPKEWITVHHKIDGENIVVPVSGAMMYCRKGDYLIKDEIGEFYPIKKNLFEKEFEEV